MTSLCHFEKWMTFFIPQRLDHALEKSTKLLKYVSLISKDLIGLRLLSLMLAPLTRVIIVSKGQYLPLEL